MKIFYTIALLSIVFGSNAQVSPLNEKPPKNIILLIADGTGIAQISTSFYYGEKEPNYARFKQIGLIKTSSSSHLITDSAAGATAFSTGKKSYNGAIGVDADAVSFPSIVEILSERNYATGVIATSTITHATPASFFAHVKSRHMHEAIANDLVNSPIDFFAGGGLTYFIDREDGQNLLEKLANKDFVVDTSNRSMQQVATGKEKYAFLLAEDALPKMSDGRGDFLPNATETAIKYLDNVGEDGFFLMAEGSQIDWGGHENDGQYIIDEVLDFDKVLGVALDFAEKDGETLVIVTADHETGGFALSAHMIEKEDGEVSSDYNQLAPTFSTGGHTASLIPVFAYGPGASDFIGIYENTEIFHKIMKLLATNDLTNKD